MTNNLQKIFGRLISAVIVLLLLLSSSGNSSSMIVPAAVAFSTTLLSLSTKTRRRGTTQHGRWSSTNHCCNKYSKQQQFVPTTSLQNIYDDWRSDAVVDTMYLDEENVEMCLEEFINSDYGRQMFGCHELPASIGITGTIEFVELCGPEVTLHLEGQFWHRRDTVLGRAAMWLNARMPEITDVIVPDMDELKDYDEIIDELSGEVLFRTDRRSPDYNGDREVMEYQGRDPDMRGPFTQGPMGGPSGSMINPV